MLKTFPLPSYIPKALRKLLYRDLNDKKPELMGEGRVIINPKSLRKKDHKFTILQKFTNIIVKKNMVQVSYMKNYKLKLFFTAKIC